MIWTEPITIFIFMQWILTWDTLDIPVRVMFLSMEVCGWDGFCFSLDCMHCWSSFRELVLHCRSWLIWWRFCSRPSRGCSATDSLDASSCFTSAVRPYHTLSWRTLFFCYLFFDVLLLLTWAHQWHAQNHVFARVFASCKHNRLQTSEPLQIIRGIRGSIKYGLIRVLLFFNRDLTAFLRSLFKTPIWIICQFLTAMASCRWLFNRNGLVADKSLTTMV